MEETRQTIQVADAAADVAYEETRRQNPDFSRIRTALYVPIVKERDLIGAFMIYRHEVRPFTDKQIELVKNFAAQAVIAIENTRLLNELRQRTDDLTESLEQQTATSEVLKVIIHSPGDLEPVFEAMLANAVRICGAKFGVLSLREGDAFRVARQPRTPIGPCGSNDDANRLHADPGTQLGPARFAPRRRPRSRYPGRSGLGADLAKYGGARRWSTCPCSRTGELIGSMVIFRQETGPFTDKQIELVQNFAAQAVIAIENTRLLNELRESLQQQTATSDVLKVISSSPGELDPVFQAMLDNATRICEANFGVLNLHEDGKVRMAAMHNVPAAFAEFLQSRDRAYQPIAGSLLDRVIRTKQVGHTADEAVGRAATLGGAKSTVCVPMLKDDDLVGTITIYRQEVRPFSDKQIELLRNFAAQAVIAIENARLLSELRHEICCSSKQQPPMC